MSKAMELIEALNGTSGNQMKTSSAKVKALAWARVSTDMQEERNLSIPEQLRQIREYAERFGIEIVQEYSEAASAFQKQSKRVEFYKMIEHAQRTSEISAILIHDYSRFSRDSISAKTLSRDLKEHGIKVISLNDADFDTESSMGVFIEAFTFAKNEAYSKEVAFHTRKGCRANINTRDKETGWCYKNGGLALWGYKSVRLQRGFERKGVPITKVIWELDDTIVAGRPVHEWVRYCLVELAMKGASLADIRDFCNKQGIPARHNQFWSLSTWRALLEPPVLMEYCGYGVWNVRRKNGSFKPTSEWEIVENAHPAIITEDEARAIGEMRKRHSESKRFDKGWNTSKKSKYLLSGGLMKCGRCGSNMTGFMKDKEHPYYVCGSIQYRKGQGCGPGVYIAQREIEDEVLDGLNQVLVGFTVTDGFVSKVNTEFKRIWESKTGSSASAKKELKSVESKIQNIYKAVEDGLPFDSQAKDRLNSLAFRKSELLNLVKMDTNPPEISIETVISYKNKMDKVLKSSSNEDRKRFIRQCVDKIKLVPDSLEVEITYKIPEPVVDYVVAGGGFEPPTFGL